MGDLSSRFRQRVREEEAKAEVARQAESKRQRKRINRGSRVGIGVALALAVGATPLVLSAIAGEKADEPESQDMVATVIQDDGAQQVVSSSAMLMGENVTVTYGIGDEFSWDSDGDGVLENFRVFRIYDKQQDADTLQALADNPSDIARAGNCHGFSIAHVCKEGDMFSSVNAFEPGHVFSELFVPGEDPCISLGTEGSPHLDVEFRPSDTPETTETLVVTLDYESGPWGVTSPTGYARPLAQAVYDKPAATLANVRNLQDAGQAGFAPVRADDDSTSGSEAPTLVPAAEVYDLQDAGQAGFMEDNDEMAEEADPAGGSGIEESHEVVADAPQIPENTDAQPIDGMGDDELAIGGAQKGEPEHRICPPRCTGSQEGGEWVTERGGDESGI